MKQKNAINPRSLDKNLSGSAEERILAAAMAEFAANGFHGARMQAIADTAHVNKAMLHYYFRSKDNLYHQIIRTGFQRIIGQVLEDWTGPGSLETRIEKIVDTYLDNYARNPDLIKIVLHETIEGGVRFKQAFKEGRIGFPAGYCPGSNHGSGCPGSRHEPHGKTPFYHQRGRHVSDQLYQPAPDRSFIGPGSDRL